MGDPDTTSIDIGFDIQEMVAQRLAVQSKKTVQLEELLRETKFTKEEIRTMYRGFKQVGNKHTTGWHKNTKQSGAHIHMKDVQGDIKIGTIYGLKRHDK